MNRRFAFLTATFAITSWLLATGPAGSSAAATDPAPADNAADAKALKLAQTKLAALAKKGAPETPPAEAATKKGPEKKKGAKARKKKTGSARSKAKGAPAAKVKNLERRMTQAEVQGVLSTTRDFSGSDLSGLNLVGYDLRGAKFNRAKLNAANLERADLAEADLELADLTGANLRGASLSQARLRGTRMAGAKIGGALWIDKTICREGSVGSCIE